jgi:hypothetical protein
MADSSEHSNEASGFINDGEILEYLRVYEPHKKDSVPWH